MRIVADTHIHLYPTYNLELALGSLIQNLRNILPGATNLAFFVERHDCHFFSQLRESKGGKTFTDFELNTDHHEDVITISKDDKNYLYLFPGRQIKTSEGIELLSLTTDQLIEDDLPADTVIQQILDAGGVPVISWAPGKWFFQRGKVIKRLIEQMHPNKVLIGDTSLRPTIWMKPYLMRKAEKIGYKIVAGSDPLPFSGEEVQLGTFGSQIDGEFNEQEPVNSVRSLLTDPEIRIESIGRRNTAAEVLQRLVKNAKAK